MARFRPRLTYANVMATLAFFLALGGGAYAAATIGSSQIKKNAVLSRHIKNGQVKNGDLAGNSVGSGKIKDGQVSNSDLAGNSVDSSKIAPGSIANPDIGPNSVGTGNVIDGSLDASDFATGVLGARAWALGGQNDCITDNTLCPLSRSKGVISVRHTSGGTYCVAVNGVDASTPGSVALVGAADTRDVHVSWLQQGGACSPGEFEIVTSIQGTVSVRNSTDNGSTTVSTAGTPLPGVQFVIVIP